LFKDDGGIDKNDYLAKVLDPYRMKEEKIQNRISTQPIHPFPFYGIVSALLTACLNGLQMM